ncbi:hypothetical protein O3M35_005317 [Rhynocoris fuscipes]|uniref:Uncharacterized protein n=1 Tax=Rhynocoris fuscipes TaxID=488301 RepID=A0AAW1DIA4_9HEMI
MNGSSLSMGPVTRHQAGMYQCIANNGVGYPAVRELTLRVLCEYRNLDTILSFLLIVIY